MEWFRKLMAQLGGLWGKWSMLQRVILVGIVVIVIVGTGALVSVSSSPSMVPLINAPIRDENALDRIKIRLDREGIDFTENSAGIIMVKDKITARRMIGILTREDLIPQDTDPWAIFDRDRWTITDFERNVNLRRAITQMVTDHIKALDDVDNANVAIVVPEDRLFVSEQNPVSASVMITPKPGSDISTNRKKIEGIQKLLKFAIEGLKDENIVITDHNSMILNNFEGMAEFDRLTMIEKQTRMIRQLEAQYRVKILTTLQKTFTEDRVRDLDIKIAMDMSQKSIESKEITPIMMKERTPGLAYDDSIRLESLVVSSATSRINWEGTGFNPEGPPGTEGNVPPVYRDMSDLYGKVEQETAKTNYEWNGRTIQEQKSPEIDRVTVSVFIDGTWKWKFDAKRNPVISEDGSIERVYTPVDLKDLEATRAIIQDAIGYSAARGDSVTVRNVQFDRTKQFTDEDAAYFRQKNFQMTIMVFLIGLAVLLIAFILFRVISREIERRKRLAAEERSRREEALRQQALMQAEEEGMDVSISVEERTRMELQEAVANMTKEHPEDAAQLIRTWLLEE